MEHKAPRSTLVKITWTLIAMVLPCPLLQLVPYSAHRYIKLPEPRSDTILGITLLVVIGAFAIYWFLLWVSGKFLCAVLGILVLVVVLKPSIPPKAKLTTAIVGFISCGLLLWWVEVVKHQW